MSRDQRKVVIVGAGFVGMNKEVQGYLETADYNIEEEVSEKVAR